MAVHDPQQSQTTPPDISRRGFLFALGVGLNVVAATLVTIPIIGYVFSSFRYKTLQEWIQLGPLATYRNPFTSPWDGSTADIPCWVRRLDGEKFQVFAINCAHLGCPVRWFQESGLFMCPCHGGVYYADGSRASGPPPRGLFEYEYKVQNGHLWVLGGQLPTLSSHPEA